MPKITATSKFWTLCFGHCWVTQRAWQHHPSEDLTHEGFWTVSLAFWTSLATKQLTSSHSRHPLKTLGWQVYQKSWASKSKDNFLDKSTWCVSEVSTALGQTRPACMWCNKIGCQHTVVVHWIESVLTHLRSKQSSYIGQSLLMEPLLNSFMSMAWQGIWRCFFFALKKDNRQTMATALKLRRPSRTWRNSVVVSSSYTSQLQTVIVESTLDRVCSYTRI